MNMQGGISITSKERIDSIEPSKFLNKAKQRLQVKNQMKSRNYIAVHVLLKLGYPRAAIRKALHKLTGISRPEMAGRLGVSRPTVTANIDGTRCSAAMQAAIADIWEVPTAVLFDSDPAHKKCTEACALRWEDYDDINDCFVVRQGFSAGQLVESTKTGAEHLIPCHPAFYPIMRRLRSQADVGGFIFVNARGRTRGRHYTYNTLRRLWSQACKKAGEDINLYAGLKHSSCSQYVNERGLSIHDVQALTDHANLDSVRHYATVTLARRRELMSRPAKVINIAENYKTTTSGKSDD